MLFTGKSVEFHEVSILSLTRVLILGQATLALLVTNLQIVSTMIYRKFQGSDGESQDQRPNARPFDSDVGTATRERRRTGLHDDEAVQYYPTTVPSYTIASLVPSSIPSSQPTSTSEPSSISVGTYRTTNLELG